MANKSTNTDNSMIVQPAYGVKEPRPIIAQPAYGVKEPQPIIIQPAYGIKPPSSELGISDATHGRSIAGAVNLKNDFAGNIEYLIQILNGDYYTNFKKTIKANWVGTDATDFLNDVEKTRKDLEKTLRSLKTKFNAAVEADAKQFSNFQSKNVK